MKRILQLDGVRALAFLAIFLRHSFGIPLFWAGVDVFFVLSGFLITSVLMDSRGKPGAWSHFYERRALRILPSYVLSLILATYFFHLHWGKNVLWYVFFAMNFAEAFNVGVAGLGILWSLAVEEQFYVFWPMVALRFTPSRVLRIAGALVVVAPLLRGACTPLFSAHWPIYYLMPFRMDLLAEGAVLAVFWRRQYALALWRLWGIGLMAGGATVFLACMIIFTNFNAQSNGFSFNILGYSWIGIMASGLIAYTLGSEKGFWMRLMTAPPVRWVGLISYTGYLVHAGALGLITPFQNSLLNYALAFAFTVTYASASWLIFEKPILRLRPSAWIAAKRKQEPAPPL